MTGTGTMTDPAGTALGRFGEQHPRLVTWLMAAVTIGLAILAAVPSLVPSVGQVLFPVTVDTDPENMLPADHPVRVFHNRMTETFDLNDIVVVGLINETHPDGVFNVSSLTRIHQLTEFALGLRWPDPEDPERTIGVDGADVIAPSVVDNIEQAGLGTVSFSWLMPTPPTTREEALAVRTRAAALPLLDNTLVSADGSAIALYLPLTNKDLSYRVRRELLAFTEAWPDRTLEVHITGLPVAEDTFGIQMFYQMAISAPLAMLVIFLIMWWFFKSLVLVISPMIVAMVSALTTMGLLVVTGNTIHIMSSMIPIFIMPIAVLDAVHILSEFFDRYPAIGDRRRTMRVVLTTLHQPMLFTTLTTMAGFTSLALTPIPPVQVFGVFVAAGVFLAWLWTMLFIPAYVMMIPERRLAKLRAPTTGAPDAGTPDGAPPTRLACWLAATGRAVHGAAKPVLALTLVVVAGAIAGITQITINDNPVKWFESDHPIRVADRALNERFGGSYMAYLSLAPTPGEQALGAYLDGFFARLDAHRADAVAAEVPAAEAVFTELRATATTLAARVDTKRAFADTLGGHVETRFAEAPDDQYFAWDEAQLFLDSERQRAELFKDPEVLRYLAALQDALAETDVVGKVNGLPDIVKTVHRELLLGEPDQFRIPDSAAAVAQTLLTFQNSHRPHDLWHFVTPDYRQTNLWVQLTSGDNQDMSRVVAALEAFMAANPPPVALNAEWFGLTYINLVWQDEMVTGMLRSLLGSFAVVLILMVALFRSVAFGLMSMVPLTVTIGMIYGVIGVIGKDYDMPIAVLSALSLGLAIDYAIHFLARARAAHAETGRWATAVGPMFDEPARAITRNAVVLGVGFLPLLAAPLVPYQTVGVFIAAILVSAGIGTLLILPALITLLEPLVFRRPRPTAPDATAPAAP